MLVTCSLVFQPPPYPSLHSESRGDTNTVPVILAMAYEAFCDLAWYPCDLRVPPRPPQLLIPLTAASWACVDFTCWVCICCSLWPNSLLLGFPTVSVQVSPISCPDSPCCMKWNHHHHRYLPTALCYPGPALFFSATLKTAQHCLFSVSSAVR